MNIDPPELIVEGETSNAATSTKQSQADTNTCNDNDENAHNNAMKTNAVLVKKLTNLEKFFAYYNQWTSSSVTTERGVKLAQWLVWLFSRLAQQKSGKDDDAEHYRNNVSPALRKIYNDISTMRYILRFYGLPPAIEAAMTGCWGGNWKDGRIRKLSNVMAWSMVIYHPLEHVAWMQWNMPKLKLFKKVDGNKLSAWSCRLWFVYIVADWISSYLKNCELREQKEQLLQLMEEEQEQSSNANANKYDNALAQVQDADKAIYMNKLQMIRCALFSAPCVSWSLDEWATNPWLSENVGNGLLLTEAIVCLYQSLLSLKTPQC